ncbi:MAG: amino acid--tRNA ligase-related protein, partial [Candidatus Liptonbacteria bacterium]
MLEEIVNDRKKKLARIKGENLDPYPARTKTPVAISLVLKKFGAFLRAGKKVVVAGRIMSLRDQGSLIFVNLRDESGEIQLVIKKDNHKDFLFWKSVLDRGDIVSATGTLFITKSGQKSVETKLVQMLAKSILPIPTEWFGVEDLETRLRKRYVDLMLDPALREVFRKKNIFWQTFREELTKEGFLEVELPVFEALPGGAEAEPFKTYHNSLDTDFYLRISLELPLKKLLVGGFNNVFEIGRIFRNEGMDKEHLQDYAQLEFYWAYRDYNDLMKLVESMYKKVIKRVTGGLTTSYQGQKLNWGRKWPKVDYIKAFKDANNGLDPISASEEELIRRAKDAGAAPEPHAGRGRLIDLIYKKTVRPKLVQPCFLVNPPVAIEPLAKRNPENLEVVERMQVIAG